MKKFITFIGTLFAGSIAIGQATRGDSVKTPVRKVLATDVKSTTTTPGQTGTHKVSPVTWKANPVTVKGSTEKKGTTVTQKGNTVTVKDSPAKQKASTVKSPGNK